MEDLPYELVESFLADLRRQLQRRGVASPQVIEEVRTHLSDAVDAARATGMDAELAQQEALQRFGSPDRLAGAFATSRSRGRHRLVLVTSLLVGIAMAYLDSRPSWDDTGVTAAVVAGVCGVLGFLAPRRAWLVAVLVGGGIPMAGIALHSNVDSLLALAVAGVTAAAGATLGVGVGRLRAHD